MGVSPPQVFLSFLLRKRGMISSSIRLLRAQALSFEHMMGSTSDGSTGVISASI